MDPNTVAATSAIETEVVVTDAAPVETNSSLEAPIPDVGEIPAAIGQLEEVPASEVAEPEAAAEDADNSESETEDSAAGADAADAGAADDAATENAAPEPVVFDATLETSQLIEAIEPVLDKYEMPDEVAAAIEALKAKAVNPTEAFSVYGGQEAVDTLLTRQALLEGTRPVEEGSSQYRPNTDKFLESIPDPEIKDWLFADLATQPSEVYKGCSKFEEQICNLFARANEAPQETVKRYHQLAQHLRDNTTPSDKPAFIPDELVDAWLRLDATSRDEIALLDMDYEDDVPQIKAKLQHLELIQKGIESDRATAQRQQQQQQQAKQAFSEEVMGAQEKFYTALQEQVTSDLMKNIQFSTDAKMQTLLANQQVALFADAITPEGEYARAALKDAGINFDYQKATTLQKEIERASVEMVRAKTGPNGRPADPITYNKAVKQFETVTRQWQTFAQDAIGQVARLVSTGKAEEVQTAAEKIKIAPKARVVPKGAPTPAVKHTAKLAPVGTQERYEQIARMEMDRQRKLAEAYQ